MFPMILAALAVAFLLALALPESDFTAINVSPPVIIPAAAPFIMLLVSRVMIFHSFLKFSDCLISFGGFFSVIRKKYFLAVKKLL